MRFADSPRLISLALLEQFDKEPAGTYLATPKIDGRRRQAFKRDDGTWEWQAKNRGDCQPVPEDLRKEFEALPWPAGIGLDMEWSGPRDVGGVHRLHVFDVLMLGGEWLQSGFENRSTWLWFNCPWALKTTNCFHPERIHLVGGVQNPGMVELFERQVQDPLSEGIVVRSANQVNIGDWNRSVENPNMWKIKMERGIKERGK